MCRAQHVAESEAYVRLLLVILCRLVEPLTAWA